MRKSITKSQAIKAIKTEKNLSYNGDWFEENLDYYKKDCNVCAVGAILRNMSFEKWARKISFDLQELGWVAVGGREAGVASMEYIKDHLKSKNYLAALSCYFESGKTRTQCVNFIKKNFPAKLTLTITKRQYL